MGSVPDRIRTESRMKIAMSQLSEEIALSLIRSIPLIGPQIAVNRELEARITAFFKTDDEIRADMNNVMKNIAEIEELLPRLKIRLEERRIDLETTFKEYERFKNLAKTEKEKAQPILDELRREGKKAQYIGIIINLIMILLGILISHYLRIWFPGFPF